MYVHPVFRAFYLNRQYHFWLLQVSGWLGLSVVSFLTLTLWYNSLELIYIGHTLIQSLVGIFFSLPLRWVFKYTWGCSLQARIMWSLLSVVLVAFLWTVARLQLFLWMTYETGLWADFGGWFFSSLFIFLGWSGLYYSIKYYQLLQIEHGERIKALTLSKEEQVNRLKAETIAREAQLKMLRYQLNPHFLFNTLNAIYALVRIEEFDSAKVMIMQLSDFLRYSLDNDPEKCVELDQEISVLMLYLKIEKTRFGERLKLHVDLDEKAKMARIPTLLLQPLIENSIKHAVASSIEGGFIQVHATVQGDDLVIELSDTGPGVENYDVNKLVCGHGVGLCNTLTRLRTLYGDAQSFELTPAEPHGLKTTIRIPYDPLPAYSNVVCESYADNTEGNRTKRESMV